ncbi:MAG: thioredoxin family protein [Deltaproteobacteria bacterium]|nr:thioredoxin family protein [Deltaproteobacteria bacterium]
MQKYILRSFLPAVMLLATIPAWAAEREIPVKDMVTMADFGAHTCIPCKMMEPILEKLTHDYQGRAAIVFIDVWQDVAAADQFGIRTIPTQVFYGKDGKEVYRHQGFLAEKDIVAKLKEMGVVEPEGR